MEYSIKIVSIDIFLYFIKMVCINYGTYYIERKMINGRFSKIKNLIILLLLGLVSAIETVIIKKANLFMGIIITSILMTIILKTIENNEEYTEALTIVSLGLSYIIFFIAVMINGIPNILLKITNNYIALIPIEIIYALLIYFIMKTNKFRNGFTFLDKKIKNDFFNIMILNLGAMMIFFLIILENAELIKTTQISAGMVTLSIITFLTIQKSFQVYYKQKLLIQELNETKKDLKNKTEEVQKLEQENLNFSKKSHSLAHKQKSLEYKLNQLLLTTEISDEKDLKEQIQKVSKELYSKPRIELDKTGITQIDDMLNFMQSECIKNNIDFNLQLSGNIYHIINKIITEEELEILLADHIKDAIIAIKHTDNVNKSILVRLGKIEDCYGLYIYDSGIEFEKETLENLGKKPSTTHKDEGGTGMGFMNTFDTLRKCKGSLIINEIGKPSKENYTKVIMIKFNNKNEFKVVSYKENNN